MVDDKSDPITSQDTLDQQSDSFIRRAVEMFKLSSKSRGGEMGAFMERLIEEALAPKINWRTLLRNRLVKSSTMIYTYSKPDKRFLARKMTLPGPKPMDPDSLENIKLCIDTSGSISDKDLGIALAQIKQLFDSYKADAEVIYWDTQVRAVYPFKDIPELLKCKRMGGGGTDGNCVFEYFDTNIDYVRHRKKPPSTIVVFTDGYIGDLDLKYKKKYKDVIWIISENGDQNFKPNFGIVAPFNPK
jgi:predicted metal-dependent peptidase